MFQGSAMRRLDVADIGNAGSGMPALQRKDGRTVIPFGVTTVPLRPLFNTGAFIGEGVLLLHAHQPRFLQG
jgi:hypothetical protein